MPNIAQVLKSEIIRLARREVRSKYNPLRVQVNDLKKAVRDQRTTIARLEKHIDQLKAVSATPAEKILEAPNVANADKVRLSPDSIKKHRKRLGLSQSELGKLLRVSTNTIVRWELGKSKPRDKHRAGLAQLRTMGARQVKKFLEAQLETE
jgi:DNA-binding transcriptional regulator YiaG